MTKEELEKEAEKWLNKWELCNKCENKVDCISNFSYCKKVVLQSYLASAEPREKQIQIDAEQIRALQKQNGELTDKVKELEQKLIEADDATDVFNTQEKRIADLEVQIEKMKCCEICEYGGNVCRICYSEEPCNNRDKWKLSHRFSERKEYRK